jgi:tripartite-type tricarboxylate transporter receptor subunit TctC
MLRRLLVSVAVATTGLAGFLVPAFAQGPGSFPSKPVTLVVPFIPGLTGELLMRGLAESASKHLGQAVTIDNKPGGSATLGPAAVAASKPDGHTVGMVAIPVFRVPYMPLRAMRSR